MVKGYIYRHWIVNDKGEEKNYIGQVYNRTPKQRWRNGNGYKPKKGDEPTHFYNAIQAYGWDNFNHKVLFSIECETLEELVFWLDEWEKYYIEKYDSFKNGYNSTTGGSNGYIVSEETKQKQRETRRKILSNPNHYLHSDEFKTKMSEVTKGELNPNYGNGNKIKGEKNPFYGKQHSDEFKSRLSEERKGSSNPNARKVICLNTKQIFQCIKDANIWCGTEIKLCLYGKRKSAGKHPITGEKLHWMYYDEYLEQQNKNNSDSNNNKVA